MTFSDQLFPIKISYGSLGGPRHGGVVSELPSGQRKVTVRWDGALRRYDAKWGLKTQQDLYQVYNFVLAHNGAEHTFRYRDHLDFSSNASDGGSTTIAGDDQLCGVGDGSNQSFFLSKVYNAGPVEKVRRIQLPLASPAPIIWVDGVLQVEGSDYTLDYLTGEILFGTAPAMGLEVTAGFMFDVHCQFTQDVDNFLQVAITGFKAGEIPSITIDEVSSDASNSVSRSFGGSRSINLTADLRMSLNMGELLIVNPSASGFAMWLPNVKGLGSGKLYFIISNISAFSFNLNSHTGILQSTIGPGETWFISLLDNGDNTKSWVVS